jgi:F-type H+-transporting ATPase subunit alpha
VPIEDVQKFERELYRFLETRYPNVLTGIAEKKVLDDELTRGLETALKELGQQFAASTQAVVA